jgi:nitrate reductase gamma subunit
MRVEYAKKVGLFLLALLLVCGFGQYATRQLRQLLQVEEVRSMTRTWFRQLVNLMISENVVFSLQVN